MNNLSVDHQYGFSIIANALKSKDFCIAILLIPLLLGYIGGSEASSESSRWQELPWVEGFESGLRQANSTGRPALIYFRATWCSWCHIFERDILGHPQVQRSIVQHYVPVLVNYDARPELFRHLGGFGLPYTVIVSPAGDPMARLPGILSAKDMTAVMDEIATGKPWPLVRINAPATRITRLDTSSYLEFRRAYLEHLDTLFEPETGTFTGYMKWMAACFISAIHTGPMSTWRHPSCWMPIHGSATGWPLPENVTVTHR
jgi:thioredoxin-related protein